ncbi:MAG: Gfo/Idh/MocA family oxidoreductase [Armatimonadetes bacterium]|nr:Gfo/Idh/MocA family oxidoreductase [Armatimonadota bacterium]
MSDRPVRLGFVGCGYMGQMAHLPNFLALEGCEVAVLAEARPRLRELVAQRHGIPRTVDSHLALAEADDIDAVVAIVPEALNERIVRDLLAAGKSVMTEKPMTTGVESARRMVGSATGDTVHMVGYMKRYDDGVRAARRLIEDFLRSGELGEMTFVRAHSFGGGWRCGLEGHITTDEAAPEFEATPLPEWVPEDWRTRYNSLNNVYCHNINLVRWLTGGPLQVRHAVFRPPGRVWHAHCDGRCPVSLEFGWLDAHAWEEHTRVFFEHGWIDVATPPPLLRNVAARVTLYRCGDEPRIVQPLTPWTWAFANEAAHFVECVRNGAEPDSSGRDPLQDLEVVETMVQLALAGSG